MENWYKQLRGSLDSSPLWGARGSCPIKKGKNVSTITAITKDKVLATINILGSVNKIIFEAFIIRKLVPILWKGAVIILDNCPIHFSEEINKAVAEKGAQLIYLPPYSPEECSHRKFLVKS